MKIEERILLSNEGQHTEECYENIYKFLYDRMNEGNLYLFGSNIQYTKDENTTDVVIDLNNRNNKITATVKSI